MATSVVWLIMEVVRKETTTVKITDKAAPCWAAWSSTDRDFLEITLRGGLRGTRLNVPDIRRAISFMEQLCAWMENDRPCQ